MIAIPVSLAEEKKILREERDELPLPPMDMNTVTDAVKDLRQTAWVAMAARRRRNVPRWVLPLEIMLAIALPDNYSAGDKPIDQLGGGESASPILN